LKKEAKTFECLRACWGNATPNEQKFFGSFFQRRTAFSPLPLTTPQPDAGKLGHS
jgi:hypothetical protein